MELLKPKNELFIINKLTKTRKIKKSRTLDFMVLGSKRVPNILKFGSNTEFLIVPFLSFKTNLFLKIIDGTERNSNGWKLPGQ